MFRQRTSSQKPGDDLLANFRQQFPEVAVTSAAESSRAAPSGLPAGPDRSHSLGHEAFKDQDPTPKASATEQWRFTPSLLDPGSFSFTNFANQPPGYYTPTPGGTNTIYHPQAGDLHTPTLGLGMGLGTPLSMPTSDGPVHAGAPMMDMSHFHHGSMHPQHFSHFNPFVQPPQPQQSFAPSSFVHQDTGYETMDQDGSPLSSDQAPDERVGSIDNAFQSHSPLTSFQPRQFGMPASIGLPASAEKFRFHTTLNAPTAMIKTADEIPVTYLNKGQAYSVSIVDTAPVIPIAPGTKFRTFIRVSFEDEQQRMKPAVCWSLWKEGRGTNEAHQRGGKLQAVEFVEAGQPAEGDDKRTRVELESASFDGFSIIWTPGINGACECNVAVRFNFLSTDFSHSKGVKGIPVRLCAKTMPYVPSDPATASPSEATPGETCYCKVKLFRDHGAERKLSNDVAHVKKTIDKMKQQIAQAESGMKDFGKRKRGGASTKLHEGNRVTKTKHKRTWSMSSASSADGGRTSRLPIEEDLHFKLQTLQDMFTSTRPVSVLYLKGDDLDDPDLHPVALPGDVADLGKLDTAAGAWRDQSGHESATGSSMISPSPSSLSLHSQLSAVEAPWKEARGVPSQQLSEGLTKVPKSDDAGNLSGWIEALGVDASYRPPPERPIKPVACFYVRRRDPNDPNAQEYHRAVYLPHRTLKDFVERIAAKWNMDPTRVTKVVHMLGDRSLEVEMDDDVITEMGEGQDMVMEIAEVTSPVKREWEMSVDMVDGQEVTDEATSAGGVANGIALRFFF